mmetsp:Transcript_1026/g.1659  ORF Transcript_1026/g.1659 Transcript_1026/m.1659 type:complete len:300 (-) Transcript_1026:127-1026(-)|eukprot:CAMPEP_0203753148 /NCGR_PEP_ID=MMETSP0098-20131031/6958_1 /ASSEMBLY_ACC=CAM_ASM_000208 /TAXON_ID=96639 /ORGANISM=" , Strain NY0313808BC1" /LENGTH=299 /DNA_ID=CAMNT_0050643617 /DNA_START=205 /DNA_END=1104 /DNA_ORIENTATION=+
MWNLSLGAISAVLLVFVVALAVVAYSQAELQEGGKHGFWKSVSWVNGWLYTTAWSISFYPQLILNYNRRSTEGLSYNFVWLNFLGFSCLTIYDCGFYFSTELRRILDLVERNDVVFAVHATVVTGITLFQMYCFGYTCSPGRLVWYSVRIFIGLALLVIIAYFIAVVANGFVEWEDHGRNVFTFGSWLYFISYIKILITLIKYMPQVYLNYKRQSTKGWSLHNVLLDFTGGTLSFIQLFIDASLESNWRKIYDDPVKLGLSVFSLTFDIIFMIQHYVLYAVNNQRVDEVEHHLLEEEER